MTMIGVFFGLLLMPTGLLSKEEISRKEKICKYPYFKS
jgi:hypothetical protein